MTANEFKALQKSTGLTNQQTANLLQVSLRTVKYWRSGTAISKAMAELIKIKIKQVKTEKK